MRNFNQEPEGHRSSEDFRFRCVIILKQNLRLSNSTLSLDALASEQYPSYILIEAIV